MDVLDEEVVDDAGACAVDARTQGRLHVRHRRRPTITRYFPRGTIVVISRSTAACFSMASVASMPLAIDAVSRNPMDGPRGEGMSLMSRRLRAGTPGSQPSAAGYSSSTNVTIMLTW